MKMLTNLFLHLPMFQDDYFDSSSWYSLDALSGLIPLDVIVRVQDKLFTSFSSSHNCSNQITHAKKKYKCQSYIHEHWNKGKEETRSKRHEDAGYATGVAVLTKDLKCQGDVLELKEMRSVKWRYFCLFRERIDK